MEVNKRAMVIGIVALHMVLLACYTFPGSMIPERLRVIGQFYARPLFHQQWRLFSPDPPLCSCHVQARWGTRSWGRIERAEDGYVQRRVAQAIARHVQAEVAMGDTVPAVELVRAMNSMALYSEFDPGEGRVPTQIEFRLVEQCVTDPKRPAHRTERITNLRTR